LLEDCHLQICFKCKEQGYFIIFFKYVILNVILCVFQVHWPEANLCPDHWSMWGSSITLFPASL